MTKQQISSEKTKLIYNDTLGSVFIINYFRQETAPLYLKYHYPLDD